MKTLSEYASSQRYGRWQYEKRIRQPSNAVNSLLPAGDVITNSYGGKNGDRYGYDMFDELEI